MNNLPKNSKRHPARHGLSALEIFVALTLLSVGLSLSASLVVRHNRLLAEQRHYRLALDELSNQLERLAALPIDELTEAIDELKPSSFAADHLPGATLHGELRSSEIGQQLALSISWDDRVETAAPLTLSAWLIAEGPLP